MVRLFEAVRPEQPVAGGPGVRVPSRPVSHASEEELLHQVVDQVSVLPVVEQGSAHKAAQLGQGRSESLRGSGRASQDRRSEEHTSELQSPCNLVCRLLLEKKKIASHLI